MPHQLSTDRTFLAVLTILMVSSASIAWPTLAQHAGGQGIMLVTNWPDEETKRSGRFDILPFIDTLSVAYRYRNIEGRPDLSFVLEWHPGKQAIYHGQRVALRDIDGYPAMVGLEVSADVISGGRRVAEFSLLVDSMIVEETPDIIRIDVPDLSWENVFVDTGADAARELFDAGFELRNATVMRAGFAVFEGDRQIADTEVEKRDGKNSRRRPHVAPRRPRNVSIYRHPGHIDIGFDLFWLIGSGHRKIRLGGDDGPRENIGRGSLGGDRRSRSGRGRGVADRGRDDVVSSGSGRGTEDGRRRGVVDGVGRGSREGVRGGSVSPRRGDVAEDDDVRAGSRDPRSDATTRSGDRGDDAGAHQGESAEESRGEKAEGKRSKTRLPGLGKKSDDKDDDEDDDKLVPYAIAAVAAAGVLAAVGGTIGYYGNARYAPFGLTSGIVRDDGGLLLQVGVNEALIAGEGGPKRLMGRALSFGNVFGNRWVQPALGAGVLATSRGSHVEYEPSVSVGGVLRHNMVLFYGGYDVMQGSPEFSLAVDLRRIGRWAR